MQQPEAGVDCSVELLRTVGKKKKFVLNSLKILFVTWRIVNVKTNASMYDKTIKTDFENESTYHVTVIKGLQIFSCL